MTQARWVVLFACLAGGFGAVHLGFSLDWDLLNYHLYNPHALLSGRTAIDVAPAQQQTFLNPALFIPAYLVFKYLGAGVLVFTIGAIQASQLLLLWLILEELGGRMVNERWMLLLLAALSLGGPVFLNQLGGSQGDTLLSVLVLAGLLISIRELNQPDGLKTFRAGVLSGLLLGMACALKLTMTLYAVALALAAFLCFSGTRRWRIVAGLALGGSLGVLLAGGAWFAYQWQVYGNPLFPYFNNVFASPWIEQGSYRDMRFMPGSMLEWLFYPVFWLIDPHRVWEFGFRDVRVPVLIATVFIVPLFGWRRMRDQAPALGLVWLFTAFSYVLWIRLFSIYRYLSVLELLAAGVIFCSLVLFVKSRRGRVLLLTALVATQALIIHHRGPASWEIQADTATVLQDLPVDAMVVIDSYEPVAYAALWLDDRVPLVRIRANFMRTTQPQHHLHERAQQTVRAHDGRYYLLHTQGGMEAPYLAEDLAWVGLVLGDAGACQRVFVSEALQNRLNLVLCPLQRMAH